MSSTSNGAENGSQFELGGWKPSSKLPGIFLWLFLWRNHMFDKNCVCFLSELYFLVAKFLASGPCRKASEVSICPILDFLPRIMTKSDRGVFVSTGSEAGIGGTSGSWILLQTHSQTTKRACSCRLVFLLFKFVISAAKYSQIFPRGPRIPGYPYDLHDKSCHLFFSFYPDELTGRVVNTSEVMITW